MLFANIMVLIYLFYIKGCKSCLVNKKIHSRFHNITKEYMTYSHVLSLKKVLSFITCFTHLDHCCKIWLILFA